MGWAEQSIVPMRLNHTGGMRSEPFTSSERPSYFFFSHHKAGTRLSEQMLASMSQVLDLPSQQIGWDAVHLGAGCAQTPLALYQDTTPEFLDLVLRECPNLRAVHLTREAFASVASNYAYELAVVLEEDVETWLEQAKGHLLRNMSREQGVLAVCMIDE